MVYTEYKKLKEKQKELEEELKYVNAQIKELEAKDRDEGIMLFEGIIKNFNEDTNKVFQKRL